MRAEGPGKSNANGGAAGLVRAGRVAFRLQDVGRVEIGRAFKTDTPFIQVNLLTGGCEVWEAGAPGYEEVCAFFQEIPAISDSSTQPVASLFSSKNSQDLAGTEKPASDLAAEVNSNEEASK